MNYNEINNMTPTSNNTPSNNSGLIKAILAIIILLILAIFIFDNVSKNDANPIMDPQNSEMQNGANQNIDAEIDAVLDSNSDADIQSIESEF